MAEESAKNGLSSANQARLEKWRKEQKARGFFVDLFRVFDAWLKDSKGQ